MLRCFIFIFNVTAVDASIGIGRPIYIFNLTVASSQLAEEFRERSWVLA